MTATRFLLCWPFLCACTVLPSWLPSSAEHAQELPMPEERAPDRARLSFAPETFVLANGMTVVLLEDHALPKVVLDTWFAVGSRDEPEGAEGLAHVVEHLLASEAALAPGDARAGRDRTSCFRTGPPELLAALLARDAELVGTLEQRLTRAALDRQRASAPAEPCRSGEEAPYGAVEPLLADALYPPGHPYRRAAAGRRDLEEIELADALAFVRERYVPANATLVVAGDFRPGAARSCIEQTFGALERRPSPSRRAAVPVALAREQRVVCHDRVAFPKLHLAWHSPREFDPGDAELELLATILAEGPGSRLEQRLVLDARLAQEVDASQRSAELGSIFVIEALGAPGADVEALRGAIVDALDELARDGPSEAELEHARARQEARFLRRMESLLARAEAVQAYRRAFGVSDGFRRDLERWTRATREGVRDAARAVLAPAFVDLRILPEDDPAPDEREQRPEELFPAPAAAVGALLSLSAARGSSK